MAHQRHLERKKYREWVKAGLGLVYLREGLAPFCDEITKQQHRDMLDNIKKTKNLSAVFCGQCTLDNLKPDHVKLGNRQCPLHQPNCNCWNPSGKQSCPSKVCDAIYDVIVANHGSFKPFWKNTDTQQWCTDPWSIAKCFINAPGYENKTQAADIDCSGLLHLIVNNKGFHDHIQGDLNMFTKVIGYRNEIFHSSSMELDEKTANAYIQDMIAVLQDGKELLYRLDVKDAVKKLQELMKEDFIITTRNEADVVLAAIKSIEKILREKLENVPTGDEVADLDTRVEVVNSRIDSVDARVSSLEKDVASVKEAVKKFKSAQLSQQDQYNYIKKKIEFQEKLIKLYRESLLQVSAIPLQPERNHCNFSEVYVRPRMTHVTKNKKGQKEETELNSMTDIFTKDGIALKSIYVVGDAGVGKSSFCKYLVYNWCLAHCEVQNVNDEFNGVNEMKKFDFLFYVSLRHCKDVAGIKEMLGKQYKSEVLTQLLDKESEKVIIVLDGLDEWSPPKPVTSCQFQTKGLPERDIYKDYTIISTSRPWKIETLRITDREMQKRLTLAGFGESSVKKLIHKAVPKLNESFDKNKHPLDCEKELANKSLANIIQVPIMLLQLICLWFDDKLEETSKCAIYTGMLELFFSWNDKKNIEFELSKKMQKMSEGIQELPQYLIDRNTFKLNRYLINEVARLAYETLFKNTKEASLTFDSSIFEQLKISDEVKTSCLRLGLLSEDKCPSLAASTCQSTVLSFVHKSIQEYFAAVHIAIMLRARLGSSAAHLKNIDISDQYTQFIETYFSNCATLDAVLDQKNVIIMLCGLEPRIATSVSKYIYDIVNRDVRVLEYRRKIDVDRRPNALLYNIQQCILSSIEEVQACQAGSQFKFYLGDYVWLGARYRLGKFPGGQYILPDSIHSCSTEAYSDDAKTMLEYMHKCRRLESIHIQVHRCIKKQRLFFPEKATYQKRILHKTEGKPTNPAEKQKCKSQNENQNQGKPKFKRPPPPQNQLLGNPQPLPKIPKHVHKSPSPTHSLTDKIELRYMMHLKLIEETFEVIDLNVSTLKTLSVDFVDRVHALSCTEFNAVIDHLPNLKHLVALQLAGFTVTHDHFTSLCTFLSETSQFKQIRINIKCKCEHCQFPCNCHQHEVNLSKHQQLQYLEYTDPVNVTRADASNLEIFKCMYAKHNIYAHVFGVLKPPQKLTKLSLTYRYVFGHFPRDHLFPRDYLVDHIAVTDRLIFMLLLSNKLRDLDLAGILLTENIIKSPSEMKCMKLINLLGVKMSLTTWREFVDSIAVMPQAVTVRAHGMRITQEGEECNPDQTLLGGGGREAAALQYVSEKKQLFKFNERSTDFYRCCDIEFSTRK